MYMGERLWGRSSTTLLAIDLDTILLVLPTADSCEQQRETRSMLQESTESVIDTTARSGA